MNFNSDDDLNVNVNRFENDNVWNAENRNRVVVPKLADFLLLFSGSFLFRKSLFPRSDISSDFLKFRGKFNIFFIRNKFILPS